LYQRFELYHCYFIVYGGVSMLTRDTCHTCLVAIELLNGTIVFVFCWWYCIISKFLERVYPCASMFNGVIWLVSRSDKSTKLFRAKNAIYSKSLRRDINLSENCVDCRSYLEVSLWLDRDLRLLFIIIDSCSSCFQQFRYGVFIFLSTTDFLVFIDSR